MAQLLHLNLLLSLTIAHYQWTVAYARLVLVLLFNSLHSSFFSHTLFLSVRPSSRVSRNIDRSLMHSSLVPLIAADKTCVWQRQTDAQRKKRSHTLSIDHSVEHSFTITLFNSCCVYSYLSNITVMYWWKCDALSSRAPRSSCLPSLSLSRSLPLSPNIQYSHLIFT